MVGKRGTKIMAGTNVKVGRDHTLFSMATGRVAFRSVRKVRFDGHILRKKVADVLVAN